MTLFAICKVREQLQAIAEEQGSNVLSRAQLCSVSYACSIPDSVVLNALSYCAKSADEVATEGSWIDFVVFLTVSIASVRAYRCSSRFCTTQRATLCVMHLSIYLYCGIPFASVTV